MGEVTATALWARVARAVLVLIIGSFVCLALSLWLTSRVRAARPPLSLIDNDSVFAPLEGIDDRWTRRVKLTFTNTAQTEDLVNFPVLVVLDSSRVDYDYTQDAGQDIRFVDADGTTALAHEIEKWDESGSSYVWVKVPQIDGSFNSDYIWMYYGNPDAADGQDPANVWTDSYRMVYHLEGDPSTSGGVLRDSTANSFDATNQGTTDALGFIANAQEFDGINQYVNLGMDLAAINEVSATTLSAWVRPDTVGGSGDILGLSRYNGGSPTGNSRASIVRQGANVRVYARSRDDDDDFNSVSSTADPLSAGTWHYVVAVVDYADDAITIYIDGIPRVNSGSVSFDNSTTPDTNSANGALGSNDDGLSSFFDGLIDEARVAATARSADWIAAQYMSMSDAFITFGSEEDINLALLSLVKWASRDEVYAGSRLDYSLLVGNTGGRVSHVVVSDTLPAHTTFGGCSCGFAGLATVAEASLQGTGACGVSFICGLEGDEVVWRVDEMAGGRPLQMTFWVTVDTGLSDGAVIVNDSYAVVADRLAPLMVDQPVSTTVREMLVSVSSGAWPDPVTVGQQLQFTIAVRNDGSLLHNVTVTDLLPSGVSFVSCGGALCELSGGDEPEVRWWMSALPAASEQQLTLRVSVDGVEGDMLVNERYGAWIPAAGRHVMGAPVIVEVLAAPSWQYRLHLPVVLSNATRW